MENYALNAGGLTFMILAMGTILTLTVYCFWKVFSDNGKDE